MAEIRITLSEKLDKLISELAEELGVAKTDYIKSLILNDLKSSLKNARKNIKKK